MSKTIRQIANELGVSKTAVRKKIENLGLSEKMQINGNRILINDSQEQLIKSSFYKGKSETRKPQTNYNNQFAVSELVSMLQKELEIKNKQICSLQESLENTTEALRATQESLKAAQLLQANAEKKLLQLENNFDLDQKDTDQELSERKIWWQFWK